MLAEVKKCADSRDIKGLHYIFVDSLDVDPTFETYREDYEYCKKIEGMFAPHREMSPILNDKTQWTPQYWEQLKFDLMRNFSEKRFEHMISVARIVYSDKVSRLAAERKKKSGSIATDARVKAVDKESQIPVKEKMVSSNGGVRTSDNVSPRVISEEEQKAQLERKKRVLEEENRRVEAKQQAQRRRIEDQKAEMGRQTAQDSGGESKKAVGIVLAVIIIAVLAVIIIAALK